MPKDRLWTQGNRVPSEFVHDLEMARRKAEAHRKATPEAWQDYVALRKLVEKAVSKLLVLEDERKAFTNRLTIDPPPEGVKAEEADALCQDAVAGPLAYVCHDAITKGWSSTAVYRAITAYGEYMLAFERNAMGLNPHGNIRESKAPEGYGTLPPFGTARRKPDTGSR